MCMYRVKIVQEFKAERTLTVEVPADSSAEALDALQGGETETPPFDDPRWETKWHLQDESMEIVP